MKNQHAGSKRAADLPAVAVPPPVNSPSPKKRRLFEKGHHHSLGSTQAGGQSQLELRESDAESYTYPRDSTRHGSCEDQARRRGVAPKLPPPNDRAGVGERRSQ